MTPSSSTYRQESTSRVNSLQTEPNRLRRFIRMLGPGFIAGASDDDPSGIGTYSMAGAAFGYATLWLALVTFPMMSAIQFICAKVGMVTGRGLAGVIRQHYSRNLLYPIVCLLVIANTINAGADIGAVAAGLNLLLPIQTPLLIVPIGVVDLRASGLGFVSADRQRLQVARPGAVGLYRRQLLCQPSF